MTDNLPVVRYRGELLPYPVVDPRPWEAVAAFHELVRALAPAVAEFGRTMKRAFDQLKVALAPITRTLVKLSEVLAEAAAEMRYPEAWELGDNAYSWSPGDGDDLMREIEELR